MRGPSWTGSVVNGLAAAQLVYTGFSAVPCDLTPSLSELCDPPGACHATSGDVRYNGLGVLDRPVVPHLDSPQHPETALLSRVAAKCESKCQPYWALSDGQALVIDGPATHLLRNPTR